MTKYPALSRTAIEANSGLSITSSVFATDTLRTLSTKTVAQKWIGYGLQKLLRMIIAYNQLKADRVLFVEQARKLDGTGADVGNSSTVSRFGNLSLQLLPDDPVERHRQIATDLVNAAEVVGNG